ACRARCARRAAHRAGSGPASCATAARALRCACRCDPTRGIPASFERNRRMRPQQRECAPETPQRPRLAWLLEGERTSRAGETRAVSDQTILFVDDEVNILKALKRLTRHEPWTVLC